MNDEYIRMKKLLSPLGLSFNTGGFNDAEIYAYSKGIEKVLATLEEFENAAFFLNSNTPDLSKYASLLKLNTELYSEEDIRERIISLLSNRQEPFTFTDFDKAFSKIGSGEYRINGIYFIFSGILPQHLPELSKFLRSFLPCFARCEYSGSGMSFDTWDYLGYTFNKYESLGLPYSIIDTLRSEDFEQH